MDIRQLRGNIQGFSFEDGPRGNQGYERLLLQLCGYDGHGKSSFIDSCKYVLSDGEEFREEAEARDTPGGHTMIRRAYTLTDNITLVDNRGFSHLTDLMKAELYSQMGTFNKIGNRMDWGYYPFQAMMEEIEESDEEPNFSDFIVPIFIYSVKHRVPGDEMLEINTFMRDCVKMTGIMPIVVLTHKTSGDYLKAESRFRQMGAEVVISIENYTQKNHTKTLGRTTDILTVLDSALRNVRFLLERPRNPKRERIERKKFLLNFIHCADIEKQRRDRQEAESFFDF